MSADRRKHAFLVLAFGAAGAWQPAAAAEFQCRHGDLLRRVEVNTGESARNAACEVRYWRNASSPAEGQVLWRANQDPDFCDAKARDLLARLEAGGWACAASDPSGEPAGSPPAATRFAPAPPSTAAPEAPSPEPHEPAATAARERVPSAAQLATGAAATAQPSAPGAESPPTIAASQEPPAPSEEPPATVAATAEPAAPGGESAPPTVAQVEGSAAAEAVAAPTPDNPESALLDRVIGQTLESVERMYGGDFRAEDAAFGDLDGDGRDDAAVLVTYRSEREDYVQYLVAYLFDGETFQSTATKNVGGRFLDALRADVRGIVDRTIVVDLQALDAGEVCCETRRAAFVLREGQLVEVEDPAGVPRGRT